MSQAGSIYQRQSDGRWVAVVTLNGMRLVKYAQSKREAQQRLNDMIGAASTGTLSAPSKVTLGQWVEQWLGDQETACRPSTMRSYRQVLTPMMERIGQARMDRLTPLQLSRTFTDLHRRGIGTRRIQQGYVVLGTCLKRAVRLGVIGVNPLDRVDKPRHEPGERPLWTVEEARRFLVALEGSAIRYAPLFTLLLTTGLRIGEGLGLRWVDIDLQQRSLTVQQAYVYAGERGSIQPPKTRAGRRVVVLPDLAVRALQRLPRPLDAHAAIFRTGSGTVPSQSNLRRDLRRLCVAAAIPTIPLHGIRHVHAALLAAQGLDPHTLRKRLGHSRVSTTLDIYAYALRPDSAATTAFERAMAEVT